MSNFADVTASTKQLGADLGRVIAERGLQRVGIDNWYIFPVRHYLALREAAPEASWSTSLSPRRGVKSAQS